MRRASVPLFFGLLFSVTTTSCRLGDDPVATQLEPEPMVAAPAPVLGAPPSEPLAPEPPGLEPSAAAMEDDPADWTELPPELVDDGIDEEIPPPDEIADLDTDIEIDDLAPELASIAKETWVYREPRFGSRKLGYLRAGAIVERSEEAAGYGSCKGGFYEIEPHGYVCVGKKATLDLFHPVAEASRARPSLDGLPYRYATSRYPTPPMYARLPTEEEQRRHEPGLDKHLRRIERLRKNPDFVEPPPPDTTPSALLYGRPVPGLTNERPRDPNRLLLGRGRVRAGYAMLSQFDHAGRRFGLTTELFVVPIDRMRFVKPSTFEGLHLDDELTLPVAFVMKKRAVRYVESDAGKLTRSHKLDFRSGFALTGKVRGPHGNRFLETKDGFWMKEQDVVRVNKMRKRPAWAKKNRKWIDVSILKQALVAYEGDTPVYVTLVSTGVDGIGDPEETHSTIQGAFLIHTKHVSATMDSDETGDEFDLRDVPFVQYFTEGYALHAAYWHDDFGTPRSHGCVNLSPRDAAWLFGWTTPEVPVGWHAYLSLKKGTLIYTHP